MSAYRTAESKRPRQVLLCPVCATRLGVASDDEVRCQQCGARESVLRRDAGPRAEITLFEVVEVSSHAEFRDAARSFGREGAFQKLILRCDGLNISAGLDIDSGAVRGVDYSLGTAGLPTVTFRGEDDYDRLAKERGVARELQTGDEEFDRGVYIESDVPDAHLLALLAAPGVRTAIATLVAEGLSVRIVEGDVRTDDRKTPDCFGEARIRTIVGALRVLAGAPRLVSPAVEEPRTGARSAANLVYTFLPLGGVLIFLGSSKYPAVAYGNLLLSGALPALVVAVAIQPLLTRAVRGRSTSHRELVPLRSVSFVGLLVLGFGLAIFLNGALDRTAEWTEPGTVQSASHDSEDGVTSVTIRTASRTFDASIDDRGNQVRSGNAAEVFLRAGAFGQPWKPKPIVVHAANAAIPEK